MFVLVEAFGPHDCHSPITFRSSRSAQWDAPGRRCTMTNRIALTIKNTLIRLIARVLSGIAEDSNSFLAIRSRANYGPDNEPPSIAVRVNNPDRSPLRING